MAPWQVNDVDQRFCNWLADWRCFQQTASIGGQLAVLDALAALTPDGSQSLLDEIGMWSRECRVLAEWSALRSAFERSLWPLLPAIETHREEVPTWYMEAFYWMPMPYRRAALFVSFIDFLLAHLPEIDPAPFRPFQEWLVAVARWSHAIESSSSEERRALLPANNHEMVLTRFPLRFPQYPPTAPA
ncbi:MAG: hypothetical protein M5U01_11410 [Ardenticatenaceae bacterium]|nr:hypothetical protein [Ardenticatenaceae bacterium]HBY98318.1 hypothetical protein [Chloroflexota bacterium]